MIIDCMVCIAPTCAGRHSDGMYRAGGAGSITHATNSHPSYGCDRALLCTIFIGDGRVRLVPK